MPDHKWTPVEAVKERYGECQFVYQNELGEEHIHVIDSFCEYDNPRACCWKKCCGDWPGCRMTCPAFTQAAEQIRVMKREYERMPPYDPFNFMLNHTEDINEQNFYVEEFDTLDGTHWEIALDIQQQIQEILDQEGEDLS